MIIAQVTCSKVIKYNKVKVFKHTGHTRHSVSIECFHNYRAALVGKRDARERIKAAALIGEDANEDIIWPECSECACLRMNDISIIIKQFYFERLSNALYAGMKWYVHADLFLSTTG